jgi:predicted O-methyltransferase YrrM
VRPASAATSLEWLRRVSSFYTSRIILTANNVRLFDHLEGVGKPASSLAKTLRTDLRATELLLNSLVAIGLLEKKGLRYRNTAAASRYLVKDKPDYQGDILSHYDVLWENWSGLDEVLKTGRPCRSAHDHNSFIRGMQNIAHQKVRSVLGGIDLRGVKKVLDLGGGPGTYSMAFARKGKDVTLFDSPSTIRIAKGLVREAGLERGIRFMSGDFTKDGVGKGYDMVFISQIFHAFSPEQCMAMLRKSYDSLNPCGKVVVQEFYLDETRTAPLPGALFAINMLVNTSAGRTYTPKEMTAWMKKTGFKTVSERVLGDTVLVTGSKPAAGRSAGCS